MDGVVMDSLTLASSSPLLCCYVHCTPLVSVKIFAKLLTYLVLHFWNCNAVRYTTSACAVLAIVGKWCLCESSADGQLLLKHN